MAWNMGIDLSDNHHSGWHYSDTAGRAKDCGCAGNMREINREKFKCRKCGGTEVRAYLLTTKDQVEMFMAVDPAGTMRQVN